jgi:hypothetical protein
MLPNPITPTRISRILLSKKRAQYLRQRRNHQQYQDNLLQFVH